MVHINQFLGYQLECLGTHQLILCMHNQQAGNSCTLCLTAKELQMHIMTFGKILVTLGKQLLCLLIIPLTGGVNSLDVSASGSAHSRDYLKYLNLQLIVFFHSLFSSNFCYCYFLGFYNSLLCQYGSAPAPFSHIHACQWCMAALLISNLHHYPPCNT